MTTIPSSWHPRQDRLTIAQKEPLVQHRTVKIESIWPFLAGVGATVHDRRNDGAAHVVAGLATAGEDGSRSWSRDHLAVRAMLPPVDRDSCSVESSPARKNDMEEQQPVQVMIYRSHNHGGCLERTLALESVGIEYRLHRASGEYSITVKPLDETRARAELEAYERENRGWQVRAPTIPIRASGWGGVLIYWVVLIVVAVLEQYNVFERDWLADGRMNAGLIRQGEWWRTVTALSLHLDFIHLLGNLFFGSLFGLFVGQLLGSGLAWFSILIAGAVGNAINACVHPAQYSAVGASTALFAALGILSAYAWKRRQHTEHRWTRQLVPLVGGVILLAFTGTGGERTDIFAHLAGFASGLLLGAVYGSVGDRLRLKALAQILPGLAAIGLLVVAWVLALRSQLQ